MALFRNLCVNLQDFLCGVLQYSSAQYLDFLDPGQNCSFMNWKLELASPGNSFSPPLELVSENNIQLTVGLSGLKGECKPGVSPFFLSFSIVLDKPAQSLGTKEEIPAAARFRKAKVRFQILSAPMAIYANFSRQIQSVLEKLLFMILLPTLFISWYAL